MELSFSGPKMSDHLWKHLDNSKDHNESNGKGKVKQKNELPRSRLNASYQSNLVNCFSLLHSIPPPPFALTRSYRASHLKQTSSPVHRFTSLFIFIKYLLISLFIVSRCDCQRHFLPSHYDFRMCSNGFRISIYSVESFNSSSGKQCLLSTSLWLSVFESY